MKNLIKLISYLPKKYKFLCLLVVFFALCMSSSEVIKLLKEKEIEYVDLRFTDPKGKLQHLTIW